jgi:hypothetical protein
VVLFEKSNKILHEEEIVETANDNECPIPHGTATPAGSYWIT